MNAYLKRYNKSMRNRLDIKTTEPTRYEVALMRGYEVLHVYGYTARKTKSGIVNLMDEDMTHLLTADELTACDNATLKYSKKYGFTFCPGIRVAFTGNTERSAAK